MTQRSSLSQLAAFLNAVEPELGWQFDLDDFKDRFRLQKYVLLAEDFGFDHEYRYGMHLRGPYSPPLAEDYYSDLSSVAPDSLADFDVQAFAELVGGKSMEWLEIAATFREFFRRSSQYDPIPSRIETAIDRTVQEKDVEVENVRIIVDELQRAGVI